MVLRTAPKCHKCGNDIEAIYINRGKDFVGDTFLRWDYEGHKCPDDKQIKIDYLTKLINNPEIEDFLKGVQLEAAHQNERWGIENEEQKPPHHYVMVMAKLMGKLSVDIWDKDVEKFKHHVIAIAAEMANIHRQIQKDGTKINKWFKHES